MSKRWLITYKRRDIPKETVIIDEHPAAWFQQENRWYPVVLLFAMPVPDEDESPDDL